MRHLPMPRLSVFQGHLRLDVEHSTSGKGRKVIMGRFANVTGAKTYAKGNYFPNLSAKYRVRIVECKGGSTRKGKMSFIVEFEVVEIIAKPPETMDRDGKTVPIVGEKRSWFVD